MKENKQKLAIVTGAARGIGKAIAQRLFEDGIRRIALLDVDLAAAEAAAAELDSTGERIKGYACNVADAAQVEAVFKAFSGGEPIDILVNNAGVTRDAMFHKMDSRAWDDVISVNLSGVANCCRAVIPAMRAQEYGKIVNLASVSAFGNVGQTNYGASKAGVIGFTKCLALESARCNITVNAIAPSYVDTGMLSAVPEETMKRFIDKIPARRLAQPSEIAAVASFLCSDDSSFVTGECIVASGGSHT